MAEILPAILADSPLDLQEKLSFPGFWHPGMTAHIDILDGTMFGATCFCDPVTISRRATGDVSTIPDVELHLMVQNPLPAIERWKSLVPQVTRAIIHAEIERPIQPILDGIRHLNLETGIALCPKTQTDIIEPYITPRPSEALSTNEKRRGINRVLVMGIEPGASGRTFLGEPILAKIRRLRTLHHSLIIAVDGGVAKENAHSMIQSGANALVTASAIWGSTHPSHAYAQLTHSTQLHDIKKI